MTIEGMRKERWAAGVQAGAAQGSQPGGRERSQLAWVADGRIRAAALALLLYKKGAQTGPQRGLIPRRAPHVRQPRSSRCPAAKPRRCHGGRWVRAYKPKMVGHARHMVFTLQRSRFTAQQVRRTDTHRRPVANCSPSAGVWEPAAPYGSSPTCLTTVPSHTHRRPARAR